MPACDAVIVHVPAARKEVVVPFTVQTVDDSDANVTANPDEAVALRISGVPTVCAAGVEKLIDCALGACTVSAIVVDAVSAPEVPVTVTLASPVVAPLAAVRVNTCVPLTLPGANDAETPIGKPVAASVTAPVKPPRFVTAIVSVMLRPPPTATVE